MGTYLVYSICEITANEKRLFSFDEVTFLDLYSAGNDFRGMMTNLAVCLVHFD